jgi:arylsulfatase A-like enzyme
MKQGLLILLVGAWVGVAFGATAQRPNVVFVLADQWRAQASGYAGDPNLKGRTPHLDRLASESVRFTHAVSCCSVCTPYRASLLTGQYPLTHGLFLNDVCLSTNATSLAQAYTRAGYDTAYIGKWHVDGHGRSAYIPSERRQGFDYWKVLECTHDYNRSPYYADGDPTSRLWDGYDVVAQTKDAQAYLSAHAHAKKPFLLVLAWGPPHNPYGTAPERYRRLFEAGTLSLRPDVEGDPRKDLAGYYAHIVAMDDCLGDLMRTLDEAGLREDTVLVFTSDHGDMLGSHGQNRKQKPWDESIRVPLLVRAPAASKSGRVIDAPINAPDLMPTLLGLCGVPIPHTVQGENCSGWIRGESPSDRSALIACYTPFGEWTRARGGREYRGVRTARYTYVRDLNGPWLLYDNETDPYQMTNRVNQTENAALQARLEGELQKLLKKTNDDFQPGSAYIAKWGYSVDKTGTVPIR